MRVKNVLILLFFTVMCTTATVQQHTADYWIQQGDALYKIDDNEDTILSAIEAYDRAIEIDPQNADVWVKKGDAFSSLIQEEEEAIIAYDNATNIDPLNAKTWFKKGIALESLAMRGFPDSAYPSVPISWLASSSYRKAIMSFEKAIEIDPKYAEAWYNKGVVLVELEKYNESVQAYDKAIEIDPKYADAWWERGFALYKIGKYNESFESIDKAIEINPNDADLWHNKGSLLYGIGRYSEANASFAMSTNLRL